MTKSLVFCTIVFLLISNPLSALNDESCEIVEGWVTIWIDKIRQFKNEIIEFKIEKKDPPKALIAKLAYSESEYDRYQTEFESRCGLQGLQISQ